LSPSWPDTDIGCNATVRFEPPTNTFAPNPAAMVIIRRPVVIASKKPWISHGIREGPSRHWLQGTRYRPLPRRAKSSFPMQPQSAYGFHFYQPRGTIFANGGLRSFAAARAKAFIYINAKWHPSDPYQKSCELMSGT
jgi:hypothetical protein